MYRIRLTTGQEQTYRSIQELTAGVQRGEVTGAAEIYHQRSERWLSIESHPHYRMALEGGTATRTSRLKFTRPSSPVAASGMLPTPTAQKPGQGDLEELNRLLVLLDPLPTPAPRAEPLHPTVVSPPDLTLLRPVPAPPSSVSKDVEQNFGTMLRLEDLEPIPAPLAIDQTPLSVVRDERILVEESDENQGETPEPIELFAYEVAPSDLGLPIEIHLDEIPAPVEYEPMEPVADTASVIEPAQSFAAVEAPVFVAATPAAIVDLAGFEPAEDHVAPARSHRRFRPMLFVGAAAMLAVAVFALTGGSSPSEQRIVALASASPAAAVPTAVLDSTPVSAPGSAVGFPLPAAGKAASTAGSTTAPARESIPTAPLLPSAPTFDQSAGGTELVDAGSSASRSNPGGGAQLVRGYARSYDLLGTDFVAQMDRSGLVRLFSQTQLTTNDGLAGARRALDAATAAVRQYHAREIAVEKAYQDSARSMERKGATPSDLRDWLTHLSRKESQEAASEGTRLLGQIDAVFALLQAQSGRYRIEGNGIRFDNADAAARYGDLQSWITRRLEHWSGQPTSSVPITVQPILEGIGLTRLPVSR